MKRLSRFAVLAAAIALLLAACGDDGGTASTTTSAAGQSGTTSGGATTTRAGGTATTGGGSATTRAGSAATTRAGGSASGQTVTIAFVGAQTGDNANLGINISNGAELAVEQANAKGDLPVRLQVKKFDTQGDPAQAQTVKDQVVGDSSVVAIVGPAFTGESNAANPTFEQAGIPLVTPSASNPSLSTNGWKVFHRIIPNDQVQSEETAKYLKTGLKATKVAYVHDNSDYGKGLAELTKKAADAAGIQSSVFEAIDPKATDYSAAVNKVKADNPQVVFYGGYYAQAGLLVKQLRDGGVTATFLSGDGAKDPGLVEAAGTEQAEGVEVTCACADPTVATDAESTAFAQAYQKKFGVPAGTYSAEGYDAANLLIEAIREGNTTRADILNYLNEELDSFDGLTKEISFQENGEIETGPVYVYVFKAGKVTVKGTTTELAEG